MDGKRKRVQFAGEAPAAPPTHMGRYCEEDEDDVSCGNSPPPVPESDAAITDDQMQRAATDEAELRRLAAVAKKRRQSAYFKGVSSDLLGLDTDATDNVVETEVPKAYATVDGEEEEEGEREDGGDEDEGVCYHVDCMNRPAAGSDPQNCVCSQPADARVLLAVLPPACIG